MKIIIKELLLNISDKTREKIEHKMIRLEKILKHWEEKNELELYIEVARDNFHHLKGDVYRAEANLALPNVALRAEALAEDLLVAVGHVYIDLRNQVTKYKLGRQSAIRRGAQRLKEMLHF